VHKTIYELYSYTHMQLYQEDLCYTLPLLLLSVLLLVKLNQSSQSYNPVSTTTAVIRATTATATALLPQPPLHAAAVQLSYTCNSSSTTRRTCCC
jgi:hypothetical protein